jgi:ParB family chromosome partitioning protein
MKRRDHVRALFAPDAIEPMDEAPRPARQSAHAVRVMGVEIDRLADAARDAEQLRSQIENGSSVVELDPGLIDSSFISDRFAPTADRDFRRLVDSMRESGQQVPILVRPNALHPGRYQIAFGHRRREAAAELGIAVKAIVRPLSDTDLVVAQGKENAERRNLTFIERAMFAAALDRKGFTRATLNAALGVHTTEMTRLLAVAAAVPEELARAVGPAPKAGRPRWMEVAALAGDAGAAQRAADVIAEPSFERRDTDARFEVVLAALRGSSAEDRDDRIFNQAGVPVIRIERVGPNLRFTVEGKQAPGLGEYIHARLAELVSEYEASRQET